MTPLETTVPRNVAVTPWPLPAPLTVVGVMAKTEPGSESVVPTGGRLVVKLKLGELTPPVEGLSGALMLTSVAPDELPLEVLPVLLEVLPVVLLVVVAGLLPPPPPEQAAKAKRQAEAVRRRAFCEISMALPVTVRVHGNSPASIQIMSRS